MRYRFSRGLRGGRLRPGLAAAVAAGAGLLWVFWPTLAEMTERWRHDPQYSHGYFVPLFALFLLWRRRAQLAPALSRPSWWGGPLLAAGLTLRLAGTYLYLPWFDAVALLPCVAGLFVLSGGRHALRWSWPAVAFLVFMLPLPYALEGSLARPLRGVATTASNYALQTLGFAAFAEGNVIRMGQVRIGVSEACSGLGMLVIFFALSTAAALLSRRPWVDRVVLFLSAVPIALVANVVRITVTGVLYKTSGSAVADLVFHDLAGWLMMPLAVALLGAELKLLAWILPPPAPEAAPARTGVGRSSGAGRALPAASPVIQGGPAPAGGAGRWRALPVLAVIPLLLGAGLAEGRWTNRWAPSANLEVAATRLGDVPLQVGDWEGEALPLDPRQAARAGVRGHWLCRYVHRVTGSAVTVLLVCGPPGPVSVHTPDVCYGGAGYTTAGPPAREVLAADPGNPPPQFWSALLCKPGGPLPEGLRIRWAWAADGPWQATDRPRFAFAGSSYLYKIYVIYKTAAPEEPREDDPTEAFLRAFLPEVGRALFPAS
jgi:exosortase